MGHDSTTPRRLAGSKTRKRGGWVVRGTPYAAVSVAGFILAAFLYAAASSIHAPNKTPTTEAPMGDVVDAPAADVALAHLDAALTQWGADQAYSGNGPPGVLLRVQTPGTVLNWTLLAWANLTAPPPYRACTLDGVHYANHDWAFQARDGAAGTTGSFTTMPTTVPQRLGPDGDQCQARVAATGTWHVTVLVEGKRGGPVGLYRDAGQLHFDGWDARIEKDVKVGP